MSTGHSTTRSSPGLVPGGNVTATHNGSSRSVKSSNRAANTLGSGDEEGQKCLEASDSRPLVQRVRIGRREELDHLNPTDVILILDRFSPIEERSQILRVGQARNFQFVQNRTYYEAVYNCISSNSEAEDQGAPTVLELGQEVPAAYPVDDDSIALDNEQAVEYDQQPTTEEELADQIPEGSMELVDDDDEAMEKEQDADFSPSNPDGSEEETDDWLQFRCLFEENIFENLDLPTINSGEQQELPEDNEEDAPKAEHQEAIEHGEPLLPAAEADVTDMLLEDGMELVNDDGEATEKEKNPEYSPSNSDGLKEDEDSWLQFTDFFEENVVQSLDLPDSDAHEDQEVPEEDEEDFETDHDNDDDDFFSTEEEQNHDSDCSLPISAGSDLLAITEEQEVLEDDTNTDADDDFSFFEEEDIEHNLNLPANDTEDDEEEMLAVEQDDEQWMLFHEQSSDSEEEGMTLEENSDEEEEDNSDPDYAPTEEAELSSYTDFMDDLYTDSESESDDMGKDPDYYPSPGSDDDEW